MLLNSLRHSVAFDYLVIVFGALLEAAAYVLFFAPYKIVPGGIYGITIVLHYVTQGLFSWMPEGLPMGITALFFNVPLMFLAMHFIGFKSVPKTIVTFVLIAVFTDMLQALTGGAPVVENEAVLSCFYGGALLGVGVALVLQAGGTSAGTDVLARIVAQKSGIKLGVLIIVIDSCIVLLGLIAFRDWAVPLYSWFSIFLYGQVVQMLQTENPNRAVFIISNKTSEVSDLINRRMGLGGTFLHGRGMHRGQEREIILTVADRNKLQRLKNEVRNIDPDAFISTMQATKESRYNE